MEKIQRFCFYLRHYFFLKKKYETGFFCLVVLDNPIVKFVNLFSVPPCKKS